MNGTNWKTLPEILRQRRILQITGWSASTLLRRERSGAFPKRQYHPGCASPYWVKAHVLAWLESLQGISEAANHE